MYQIQRSATGISIVAALIVLVILNNVLPAQSGSAAKSNNGLPRAAITTTRPSATVTRPRPTATIRASRTPTPPLLRSARYLNDISLITEKPCGPPCFRGITIGKTTFTEAVSILRNDKSFKNVQTQDKPAAATWAGANGEVCCQLTANEAGVVNSIVLKLAPRVTVGQVISKYGPPQYVSSVDYTEREVAIGLVYPEKGFILWTTPGNAKSKLKPTDPIIILLYLERGVFGDALSMATLQAWNGYLSYQQYRNATPALTPRVTPTP